MARLKSKDRKKGKCKHNTVQFFSPSSFIVKSHRTAEDIHLSFHQYSEISEFSVVLHLISNTHFTLCSFLVSIWKNPINTKCPSSMAAANQEPGSVSMSSVSSPSERQISSSASSGGKQEVKENKCVYFRIYKNVDIWKIFLYLTELNKRVKHVALKTIFINHNFFLHLQHVYNKQQQLWLEENCEKKLNWPDEVIMWPTRIKYSFHVNSVFYLFYKWHSIPHVIWLIPWVLRIDV